MYKKQILHARLLDFSICVDNLWYSFCCYLVYPKLCVCLFINVTEYRTVSGVAGPLVILEKVKVTILTVCLLIFLLNVLIFLFS